MRALLLSCVVVLAACAAPGSVASPTSTTARPAATSQLATATPTVAPSAGAHRPAFLTHVFTDVRNGSTFRLTDFTGKTVLAIGMAVW